MLPLSEFAKFESAKSAVQIVKPWWNLITDYLLKLLVIISLLVGGMELTSGSLDCLPTVDCSLPNSRTFFSKANYHNVCTAFFTSRKAMDCKGTTVAVELKKYPAHYAKYVNSECRKTAVHWFASYFSFLLFGQALLLLVVDNFWVKFPPTASTIETFSILVIECYQSPETSFCLPHELFDQPDRNERSIVDRKPDIQGSGENEQLLSAIQQDNESYTSSSKALSSESKISVDTPTAVKVMALYEKVKRFMERIKSSRKIWTLYLIQTSLQIFSTVVFVVFNGFHVTSLKGSMKCSVNSVCIPVVHGDFTCTHSHQLVFQWALSVFIAVLILYLFILIVVVIWTISKNKYYSDHNMGKDARFLLQLLEAYDKSYAQQFHEYMSENFEKKFKATILKMRWPLSKLENRCSCNETGAPMTLSLTGLSGIPETMFDLTSLNKLELKRCELQHDEFHQIEKLRNLKDLALVECKLNKIPEKILCMTWLKVLTLKYNSIRTIGSDIRKLEELTTLDLTGNKLVSIDESLRNLGNLHTLYLYENPELGIAAIKTALKCRMLKNFKLSDSKIQELDRDVLRMYKKLNEITWTKRSKKHEEKFDKLTQLPREKLIKIGTFYVCFEEEFVIGVGRNGTCVYVGLSDDGNEVAVKRTLTHTWENLAENEERILSMMEMETSPHIVRYRYCTTDETHTFTYLVLELCEETLEDYVHSLNQEKLDLYAPRLIREILTGLLTLHTGKETILHRDLSPWNILVDVEGHMKLADFGVSSILSQDTSTYSRAGNKGPRYWRAVESVSFEEKDNGKVIYKKKSDVQVVGMLAYFILTKGGHPFGDEYNRVKNLIEGNPVDLDKLSDPSAKDLVSRMLQHEIEGRPYVEEALTHPYVQSLDRQFLMLVRLGNEPGTKVNDTNCDVVQQLNEDSSLKGVNWITMVDPEVFDHMKKYCKYINSTASLVRFVRNAWEHWRDKKTPKEIQEKIKDPNEYFLTKFPVLPVVVHRIIRKKPDWMGRPGLKNFFQVQQ